MHSRLQILVLADDEQGRAATRVSLAAAGLEADLLEASRVEAALETLAARPVDCVVTDCRLAEGGGLLLLRRARDLDLRCPFVVLVGAGQEREALAMMKAGAADCLIDAHTTPDRLAEAVRQAAHAHRAEQQQRSQATRREALADAALAIHATPTLEALVATVSARARALIGAQCAETRVRTSRERTAPLQSARDHDPDAANSPEYAEGIATVCASNRPLRLTRAELAARTRTEAGESVHRAGFLAAPLIDREGVNLGLVQLSGKLSGDFTVEDEALLVQLAQSASLSAEHAGLLARAQRARDVAEASAARLERLQQITSALSQPSGLSHVMEIIVEQAVSVLDCEQVALFALTEASLLKLCAQRNLSPQSVARIRLMSLDDGFLVTKSVAARTPIYVHDLDAYARAAPSGVQAGLWSPRTRSVLCVPLQLTQDATLGAIAMSFAHQRSFSGLERAFFESLSDQWAQAIDRARLHESERVARKQAELAREQAETANRLKDEFLATISHELRTPLQSILGWARLLRDLPLEGRAEKGLEIIERNARAQAQLIEDILDVSRIITGKLRLNPQRVGIGSIVQGAIDTLRAAADAKHIALGTRVSPDVGELVADPDRLQQVVWNLLSNAVKFTPPQGRVEVDVRLEGSDLAIDVRDSGRGISKEFLPYVFERFRQADASTTRAHTGLGLGLAIVRHLVELHGGRVSASSEGEHTGSTFTVRLPTRASLPPPPQEDEQTLRARRKSDAELVIVLNDKRVLVVDDEPDARELIAAVFSQAGARVASAVSAAEGFEKCLAYRPDLIVSDIAMPDEDGYGLLRRVRALAPPLGNLPVIALTAFARAEDRTRALRAGFTQHLAKPIDPQVLLSAAARALSGRG